MVHAIFCMHQVNDAQLAYLHVVTQSNEGDYACVCLYVCVRGKRQRKPGMQY